MVLVNAIDKKEGRPLPAVVLNCLIVILLQFARILGAAVVLDERVQGLDLLSRGSQFWVKNVEISNRLLKLGVEQKLAPRFLTKQPIDAIICPKVLVELIAHFVVWPELILDGVVHPAFTVLIFDELLAETERSFNEPCVDQNTRRARILLAHLNV